MKKAIKNIKIIALVVLTTFIGIGSVFADTLTYVVSTPSGAHAIKQGTCYYQSEDSTFKCSGYSGSLDFFCIDGPDITQGIVGAEAYEKEVGPDNFIVAKVLKDNGITETSGLIANTNHDLYSQIENALYARSASDEATRWYNTYNAYKNGFNPTISNSLQFTLSGTNYVATATISNLGDYAEITCNSNKGTATVNGNTVTVSVPKSSITSDTNVTLTCSASYEYYMSQLFDGQDGSQDLAIKPKKYTGSKSLNASGNIEADKKGSITITKYGKNSQNVKTRLNGVKFKIKNKDGHYINASGQVDENYEFTTENGIIKVTNIEIPDRTKSYKFKVQEISTLSGYARILGEVEITLNSANNFTYADELINETVNRFINELETIEKDISKTKVLG